MRSLIVALLLCLPLAAPLRADDDTPTSRYVTLDSTRLLAKPSAFGKTLAKLKRGQMVTVYATKNGYSKVNVSLDSGDKMGFLSVHSIQDHKPKMTAAVHASGDASAAEVAAATKGFNKQIETDLRAKDTKGGYKRLDEALGRTGFDDPQGILANFREQGKLGEYKEGGE